jgi:hypothetical protein
MMLLATRGSDQQSAVSYQPKPKASPIACKKLLMADGSFLR